MNCSLIGGRVLTDLTVSSHILKGRKNKTEVNSIKNYLFQPLDIVFVL